MWNNFRNCCNIFAFDEKCNGKCENLNYMIIFIWNVVKSILNRKISCDQFFFTFFQFEKRIKKYQSMIKSNFALNSMANPFIIKDKFQWFHINCFYCEKIIIFRETLNLNLSFALNWHYKFACKECKSSTDFSVGIR